MISLLYFLDFSLKSYNVCEFKPNYDNYDYCALQKIQPNGGSTVWSFFPLRTDELDAVNMLNEPTKLMVLGGRILSVKQ